MANVKATSQKKSKNDVINFVLKVKASRRKDGPFEMTMDLNPELRLLGINETFSTQRELAEILGRINAALESINKRTCDYNNVLEINENRKKELKFNNGYEQNFKPDFGKIDKIILTQNSPVEASVSYARRYNGDKKPI